MKGRHPFAKDTALDYEYDSEEEWEGEDEEGEELASDDDEDEDGSSLGSEEEDDWLVADEERQNESSFGTPRPSSPSGRKSKALRIVDAVIFEPMFDDVALGELAPNARFADYACEILVDGGLLFISRSIVVCR